MDYSVAVIEHFERPRNVAGPDTPATHVGRAGSKERGAFVEFRLDVADGRVRGAAFRAWGCPHTIAVASWLTGELAGSALDELVPLDLDSVTAALGLPAEKWHCVLIADDALRAAIATEEFDP